jgi:pimeloyl-ACP methyl ester carboxylesterase
MSESMSETMPETGPETALHTKEMRGLTTGWLTAGADATRPIVLLMHGFPDSAESWDRQIAALTDRYQVVAPYVRGAGPSEKASDLHRYAPDSVALDALAILDEVDPTHERRVFLVGHDLGAVHAWHIAGLLQKRAAGLVIINGLTIGQMSRRLTNPRQLAKSWYMLPMQIPVLPELLLGRFADRFLTAAHRKGGLPRAKRPDHTLLKDAITGPLNQYRAFLRATPKSVKAPRRRLGCPVLVIFGAEDAFLEPPTHAEIARDATNLTVRILPGNHWLHRDEPEKINRLLRDFFAAHEAPSDDKRDPS